MYSNILFTDILIGGNYILYNFRYVKILPYLLYVSTLAKSYPSERYISPSVPISAFNPSIKIAVMRIQIHYDFY